jgi:hypothetical protein
MQGLPQKFRSWLPAGESFLKQNEQGFCGSSTDCERRLIEARLKLIKL